MPARLSVLGPCLILPALYPSTSPSTLPKVRQSAPHLEFLLTHLDLGARLAVYAPATRELLSEVEGVVKENYNANEAGLHRKEGHYRAEMVRLQGAMALDLKTHKWLEEEHVKVLEELGVAIEAAFHLG